MTGNRDFHAVRSKSSAGLHLVTSSPGPNRPRRSWRHYDLALLASEIATHPLLIGPADVLRGDGEGIHFRCHVPNSFRMM